MPRTKKDVRRKQKSIAHKSRTAGGAGAVAKAAKSLKVKTSTQADVPAAGKSRAEGIRLFKLAGRPSKEQFVAVYGPKGPRMTWDERAKAGVTARQFQAVLATKHRGNN